MKMSGIHIRTFELNDFPAAREIYRQGIDTKHATFETAAPGWEEWNKKFLSHSRLVAVSEEKITGWAALSQVSARPVYAGVCEVSVYIHKDHRGKGIGRALLQALIDHSERNNVWTLQAGIFPENKGSLKLHRELGFREVGYREKIGKMDGRWRDTILMERRSRTTGIE